MNVVAVKRHFKSVRIGLIDRRSTKTGKDPSDPMHNQSKLPQPSIGDKLFRTQFISPKVFQPCARGTVFNNILSVSPRDSFRRLHEALRLNML